MKVGVRNGSLGLEWEEAFAAAGELGFDGWLILETPRGEDPKESARLNLEFTRKAFL